MNHHILFSFSIIVVSLCFCIVDVASFDDTTMTCKAPNGFEWKKGTLQPSDISITLFEDWISNHTVTLSNGVTQEYAYGAVPQINTPLNTTTTTTTTHDASSSARKSIDFSTVYGLPQLVDSLSVEKMLGILKSFPHELDQLPDSVDGMPSYEMFIKSKDPLTQETPDIAKERHDIKQQLDDIINPLIEDRITPLVRQLYPDVCNSTETRECTVCSSLYRRYQPNDRQSHATHYDNQAIATVVVSLSNYGTDYRGGLYVSTGHGQRQYLPLNAGDGVLHQSTLYHGVKVYDVEHDPSKTQRWSWIMWFLDSDTCEDHSLEWYKDCSDDGNPICQQLHASKVSNLENILNLNKEAAEGGSGEAAIKVARAYLGRLPSNLEINPQEAKRYYEMAVSKSFHPEGYYGLAEFALMEIRFVEEQKLQQHQQMGGAGGPIMNMPATSPRGQELLLQAIEYFERAAYLGHVFSMINLGIVHLYGYVPPYFKIDYDLAEQWFVASGLPEGLYAASFIAFNHMGDEEKARMYHAKAVSIGYGQPWRNMARQHVGSGGAGGVDMNLPWPLLTFGGDRPMVV